MTHLRGETFEVGFRNDTSTIYFKGALRLTGMEDYAPILDMLRGLFHRSEEPIVVDIRELEFLNSSGITMFSRFVIETRDHGAAELHFIASETIPWHGRSLKNLQRLMPSLNVQLT